MTRRNVKRLAEGEVEVRRPRQRCPKVQARSGTTVLPTAWLGYGLPTHPALRSSAELNRVPDLRVEGVGGGDLVGAGECMGVRERSVSGCVS